MRLYGDVGADILASDVAAALDRAGGRDVTVHLFSYGGDAGEGLAIHELLSRYQGATTVVIDGVAASAASMVAMGADRVAMPANSLLMIHDCWSMAVGNAEALRAGATLLDSFGTVYRNAYADRSGQPAETVAEWMAAGQGGGTWFTAEEAVAAGLADEVIAPVSLQASAPVMPAGRFDGVSAAIRDRLKALGSVDSLSAGATPEPNPDMTKQTEAGAPADTAAPVAVESAPVAVAAATPAPVAAAAAAPVVAASSEVAALQRENQIRRCAAEAGLAPDAVQSLIDGGRPFAEVALEIVRAHASVVETRAAGAGHPARLTVTADRGDRVKAGIADMIYARINSQAELSDAGREFRGYSLIECIRALADVRGQSTVGMSKSQLAAWAMHSTSDFPLLFSNLAGKSLDAAYQEEPHTWRQIARQRNLPDFKAATDLVLAADLTPELLLEGGEYRQGTLTEGQSSWKLATYARKVCITRQAIINDDLSSLERVPELLGRGFRRLESNLVWALITSNAAVSSDGKALFHADHKNTGTGAIGIPGMTQAKKALMKQTDASGNLVNLQADFLIVPTDLWDTALQFLYPNGYAPAALTGAAGPNPYAGQMQLIVEPRLDGSATQWYAAAGPNRVDGLVFGYLADEPGPTITSVPERDPDGLTLLARFDFGCAVKDYRFIYRSSGV